MYNSRIKLLTLI